MPVKKLNSLLFILLLSCGDVENRSVNDVENVTSGSIEVDDNAEVSTTEATLPLLGPPNHATFDPFAETVRRTETGLGLGGPRIYGGLPAQQDDDPWQVALLVRRYANPSDAKFCGGTIIHPSWVLTAAHCVSRHPATEYDVFAGNVDLEGAGQRIQVDEKRIHYLYSAKVVSELRIEVLRNDIALLKLKKPLVMSAAVQSISYGLGNEDATDNARVTGFGALESGSMNLVNKLMFAELPIVSNEKCNLAISYDGHVTTKMLCAGYDLGGVDTCRGDSGGPLTVETVDGDTRSIEGITSWGVINSCGEEFKYGVYTRVEKYVAWIEACIDGNSNLCLTD